MVEIHGANERLPGASWMAVSPMQYATASRYAEVNIPQVSQYV